jgi:hypothetical protein
MQVSFTEDPSLAALDRLLQDSSSKPGTASLLILGGETNLPDSASLDALLRQQRLPLIGGLCPQILHGRTAYEHGWIVVAMPEPLTVRRIDGLSDPASDFAADLERAFADVPNQPTILVFVDGLAKRIAGLIDALFDVFGTEPHFLGGGAGSLSFVQKPCVLSNEGVHADAAVIGLLAIPSSLSVGHGWRPVVHDLQLTSVDRNVIRQIDYRPAFEVYAEQVNALSPIPISADNFFQVAQAFPFGINKLAGEHVVRDPIAVTPEGALVCVGELTQGDFVDLLTATADQLIEAAGHTARRAAHADGRLGPTLFIDCISRALFLGERLTEEVEAVKGQSGADVLFGAMVLGEIANSGSGYLEFYNKTSVVATF